MYKTDAAEAEREIDRLRMLFNECDSDWQMVCRAAIQALGWALDPRDAMPPTELISRQPSVAARLGTPEG